MRLTVSGIRVENIKESLSDTIQLVAQYLDVEIDIVEGLEWPQIIDYARQKKLDAILTAMETPERTEFLNFTNIYLPTPLVIMTKQDYQEIQGPEDLKGKKVALVNGYYSRRNNIAEPSGYYPGNGPNAA